jgi:hypothetical protein
MSRGDMPTIRDGRRRHDGRAGRRPIGASDKNIQMAAA